MQYDGTTFGIIPDTFSTILSNYLNQLQNVFPNANSPDDPIYTLAYVISTQDQLLQAALTTLWNSLNSNTAQGLGLDILANTVLNLTRKGATPSNAVALINIAPIYSTCIIQITVSAGSGSLTSGWIATGGVTTTNPYYYVGPTITITASNVYLINVQSLDTKTAVPASNFTGGTAISGATFTVTNLSSAILGSLTLPQSFQVTASSLGVNSPIYSPAQDYFFTEQGSYYILLYSTNIVQPIGQFMLNTFTDASGSANYLNFITSIRNTYAAILGTAAETDAQFSERRRFYLNVEGQSYNGLQKAIEDLNIAALQSLFIDETISETYNYSTLIIKVTVSSLTFPVVIPNSWTVYGTATPSPNYKTYQSYSFVSNGDYYIPTYSTDVNTAVGIGTILTADSPYPAGGVTVVTNLDPAILSGGNGLIPVGLGQRGYTIYLEYPTVNPESFVDVIMNVTAISGGPIIIAAGWQATGFSTTSPYLTIGIYTIPTVGAYTIRVFSTDLTTVVAANSFNGGTSVSGLTFSITQPTAGTLGGGFDVNDPNLQLIAETAFQYHAFGTQFYPSSIGATTFAVNTQFPGYTYDVILNPFQQKLITCDLKLIYNADPSDGGQSGIFDVTLLPTLQSDILELIQLYFLSKTQPTDLVYTITELSEILYNTYTGIVALIGNTSIFSFGVVSDSSSGLVFLRRPIGYNFILTNANFTFSAVNKD